MKINIKLNFNHLNFCLILSCFNFACGQNVIPCVYIEFVVKFVLQKIVFWCNSGRIETG